MDKHIRCRKLMAIGLASEKTTQSAALLAVSQCGHLVVLMARQAIAVASVVPILVLMGLFI